MTFPKLRTLAAPLLVGAALAAVAAPVATFAQSAPAARTERDAAAEGFVTIEANRALQILGDKALSVEAKKAAFRKFVDDVADVPAITGYVLGKYKRSVTDEQYRAFAVAFREFANNVYESRLGIYKGETLKVVGSTVRKPGDVIVTSEVVGGQTKEPLRVLWRVLKGADGRWRAVDVQVQGVWLAVTEQQDFVSTLDNNHGDIGVLIAQLKGERKEKASARR
jgi:phospholipid transport system substrate-binding protein